MNNHLPLLTVFYDGDCPLCKREIAAVRRRDRHTNLAFVDIAARDFDPQPYGRTRAEFMKAIHGLTRDGEMLAGLAVFRKMYAAVGLGWLWAWTGWPGLRSIANGGYRIFARIRPHLPGYPDCPKTRCQ